MTLDLPTIASIRAWIIDSLALPPGSLLEANKIIVKEELRHIFSDEEIAQAEKAVDQATPDKEVDLLLELGARLETKLDAQPQVASLEERVASYKAKLEKDKTEIAADAPKSDRLAKTKTLWSHIRSTLPPEVQEVLAIKLSGATPEELPEILSSVTHIVAASAQKPVLETVSDLAPLAEVVAEAGQFVEVRQAYLTVSPLADQVFLAHLVGQSSQVLASPQFTAKMESTGRADQVIARLAQLNQTFKVAAVLPGDKFVSSLAVQYIAAGLTPIEAMDMASQMLVITPTNNSIVNSISIPNGSLEQVAQARGRSRIVLQNITLQYLASSNSSLRQASLRLLSAGHQFSQPVWFNQEYSDNYFQALPPQAKNIHQGYSNFLLDWAKNTASDKITSKAVDVVLGKAITPVVEATVGGPAGVVVGIITTVKTFGKDIVSLAKRHFPLVAAGVAGLVILPFSLGAAIIAAVGVHYAVQPGTTLPKLGQTLGNATNAIGGIFVQLVATEIAVPIIIIFLSVPTAVALILFIISSGALIVPVNNQPLSNSNTFTPSGILSLGPGGFLGCWPAVGPISQGPPGSTICREGGVVVTCSHVSYNEQAIDIAGDPGQPIYAAHDGLATPYLDNPGVGYGIHVKIASPDGKYLTIYGHMAQTAFTQPKQVTAGTVIGYQDDTGDSTGSHVHFEIVDGQGQSTISINSVVPSYQVGSSTTGKLCKDGGNSTQPTPNVKLNKAI